MCFAETAEFSRHKWLEAKCIQRRTSLNTGLVTPYSAEDNRFKRPWEFGGLRRRNGRRSCAGLMVHLSKEQDCRRSQWIPMRLVPANGSIHVDATWNGRHIIRIDIFPDPCMIAARSPASHIQEREHRFSLVSLCTCHPTDDCRTRPVSKLWRDLLLRHHDPV